MLLICYFDAQRFARNHAMYGGWIQKVDRSYMADTKTFAGAKVQLFFELCK